MWVSLIESTGGLKMEISQRRRNSVLRWWCQLLPEFPSCPTNFRSASPHEHVSPFLIVILRTCVCVGVCIYFLLVLFLGRTPTDQGKERIKDEFHLRGWGCRIHYRTIWIEMSLEEGPSSPDQPHNFLSLTPPHMSLFYLEFAHHSMHAFSKQTFGALSML